MPILLLCISTSFAQRSRMKSGQMNIGRPPQMVRPFVPNVSNPPDANGRSILVSWTPPPGTVVDSFRIERSQAHTRDYITVGQVSGIDTSFVDRHRPNAGLELKTGLKYRYRIVTSAAGWHTGSIPSKAFAAEPKLFNVQRANVLILISVYFGSVLFYIRRTKKGKSQFIRQIAGMQAIEEALGRATEMGRPALYIPGIMDVDNIQTIASMVILTEVAKKCAEFDVPLVVPLNRAFVVPLAEESVKEGFLRSGRPDAYNPDDIRYLSDEQFAFTAGVTGIMNREKTAAHFFLGAFFAESLIVSEIGYSTGAIQIAGTANTHQLPFFVVACDYTLIGEEFYAASAYVSREPQLLGTLKGSDLVKILMMGAIFIGSFLSLLGVDAVVRFFNV
ncbi:MAG: fibronectin type III domain-containing protein [Calditrichaeota bacterium]|nr:fibronectin type III domain-containing protein [Calditrichota bacterium]